MDYYLQLLTAYQRVRATPNGDSALRALREHRGVMVFFGIPFYIDRVASHMRAKFGMPFSEIHTLLNYLHPEYHPLKVLGEPSPAKAPEAQPDTSHLNNIRVLVGYLNRLDAANAAETHERRNRFVREALDFARRKKFSLPAAQADAYTKARFGAHRAVLNGFLQDWEPVAPLAKATHTPQELRDAIINTNAVFESFYDEIQLESKDGINKPTRALKPTEKIQRERKDYEEITRSGMCVTEIVSVGSRLFRPAGAPPTRWVDKENANNGPQLGAGLTLPEAARALSLHFRTGMRRKSWAAMGDSRYVGPQACVDGSLCLELKRGLAKSGANWNPSLEDLQAKDWEYFPLSPLQGEGSRND
jgi:hypothetical protein